MSLVQVRDYREVRLRLRRPPNAVADLGIDLNRKPAEPIRNAVIQADPDDLAFGPVVHPRLKPILATIRNIQQEVGKKYGVTIIDLKSRRRPRDLSRARQIAFHLCMTMTKKGSTEIGRAFEKDHTSVLYAHQQIAKKRGSDPELDADLCEFESMFAFPQPEDATCSSVQTAAI